MLKLWRGSRGTIFAECTTCGSYGTPGHIPMTRKIDPDIQAAIEQHTATCLALRSHFTTAANNIATQVQNGSMPRKEGTEKIGVLYNNHVSQVRLAEAKLPDPTGKVKDVVTACPWCQVVTPDVEIEDLPEDKTEPDFSLRVNLTPAMIKKLEKDGTL